MSDGKKKKKAINNLQTVRPLRDAMSKAYGTGLEAAKAGKPVAWSMLTWWQIEPILMAMDIEIVYPENYGTVCAASGNAQAYLDRASEEGFPDHMCGYARNCIGYTARMKELGEIPPEAPMGGMPKPWLLICGAMHCDARLKWFQSLGRYLDAPVWTVEIPTPGVEESQIPGVREKAIDFMVKGLREFIVFLERLIGRKMDWDKLEEVTNDIIEFNRIWHDINLLRKARPCPMHSRDFWSSLGGSLFCAGDPKETVKLYQDMYDEVKQRVDDKIGAVADEKYRMLFSEIPPWHALKLFDELAERGWNFVHESWSYHPPKPLDYSKISDPLERIATQTYQYLTGYFESALKEKEYLGYLLYPYVEWTKSYQCDGALFHSPVSCHAAANHLVFLQNRLLSKLNVPSLLVQGDMVDYQLFDYADTMQKAEVFEEMMDHYKKVRQEQGLEW